jgi:hypothetical protein
MVYPDMIGPHSDRPGDDPERSILRVAYATHRTAEMRGTRKHGEVAIVGPEAGGVRFGEPPIDKEILGA